MSAPENLAPANQSLKLDFLEALVDLLQSRRRPNHMYTEAWNVIDFMRGSYARSYSAPRYIDWQRFYRY